MPFFDLPMDELEVYYPQIDEPTDFDAFWIQTLTENSFHPEIVQRTEIYTHLSQVRVFDVTFPGYGNAPISAWLILPQAASGPLPAVVEFVGYGGGRGLPEDHLKWVSAGFAHMVVDSRGQGSTWGSGGYTVDQAPAGASTAGVMTRGIETAETYYYRRFFVDAHHAVEACSLFEEVLPTRISVTGGSQGGALAIAAASLNHRVFAAMPDVPFLCHMKRAIGLTNSHPYQDVVQYLSVKRNMINQVFHTLSYFDCATLGKRAVAPALFSTALMDEVCPPSTVFASKNRYGGPAAIEVYPFNGHEGGGTYQWQAQLKWINELPGR